MSHLTSRKPCRGGGTKIIPDPSVPAVYTHSVRAVHFDDTQESFDTVVSWMREIAHPGVIINVNTNILGQKYFNEYPTAFITLEDFPFPFQSFYPPCWIVYDSYERTFSSVPDAIFHTVYSF